MYSEEEDETWLPEPVSPPLKRARRDETDEMTEEAIRASLHEWNGAKSEVIKREFGKAVALSSSRFAEELRIQKEKENKQDEAAEKLKRWMERDLEVRGSITRAQIKIWGITRDLIAYFLGTERSLGICTKEFSPGLDIERWLRKEMKLARGFPIGLIEDYDDDDFPPPPKMNAFETVSATKIGLSTFFVRHERKIRFAPIIPTKRATHSFLLRFATRCVKEVHESITEDDVYSLYETVHQLMWRLKRKTYWSIIRAAVKLIAARQRAAQRVYAPGGNGYHEVYNHYNAALYLVQNQNDNS